MTQLERGNTTITIPDDQVQHWITSIVDRTGSQLRDELDALVRQAQEAILVSANGPAGVPAPAAPAPDPRSLVAADAAARIEESQADLATAALVLEGMAALDAAGSLSEILDVLVDHAAVHSGRVLLVLTGAQSMTGWRWRGYTADPAGATMLEIATGDPGLVARAARTGATETGSGPPAGEAGESSDAENRAAVAIPLPVDGRIVAVLYADENGRQADHIVSSTWREVVEVLARHGARCLESMTARRLPELVRALAESRPAPTGPPTQGQGES